MDHKKITERLRKIMENNEQFYEDITLCEIAKFVDEIKSSNNKKSNLVIKDEVREDSMSNPNKFNKMKESDQLEKYP